MVDKIGGSLRLLAFVGAPRHMSHCHNVYLCTSVSQSVSKYTHKFWTKTEYSNTEDSNTENSNTEDSNTENSNTENSNVRIFRVPVFRVRVFRVRVFRVRVFRLPEFGSNRSWKWKKLAMQIGYRQVGKVLQQKMNRKKSFTKTQMFFVFIKFHKLSHTIIAWIGKTETEAFHDDWIGYILNVRSLPNRHRAFEIE